ncbi:MAG: PA0069 family radical SAM protein [Thalassobaculaceae bacterium]|nr:PA0069 family radical SAM protein [Thalassobaculaceae bacterium]
MSRHRSTAVDPLKIFADEFAQDPSDDGFSDDFGQAAETEGPVKLIDSPSDVIPASPVKGRGAVTNTVGRYERFVQERVDDGWQRGLEDEEPRLRTTVAIDSSRTVIARNQSPDVPFDRSINPYRGCEHGCVYCFARPTHAYLGLSPGLDFESRLLAKPDAPALLRKELAAKGYTCQPIALGTNTDPYQPVERERRITRGILEVLAEHEHPVTIVTKSDLVVRDLDILGPMAAKGLASLCLSVTTLDRDLARLMEPRAPTPEKRLAAISACAAAGVPSGVLVAPIIPAVNDSEIEAILERAHAAGARHAAWVLLRLPLEIKDLVEEWLRAHFPDRADRVLSLVRQSRGGALYRSDWGKRMSGEGPYAHMISQRFRRACQQVGMVRRSVGLDTTRFAVPGSASRQMSLFDG